MIKRNRDPIGKLFNMLFGLSEIVDGLIRVASLGHLHSQLALEVSKRAVKRHLARQKKQRTLLEETMTDTEFLPQIVQLPMVQHRLKSLIPLHELVALLPFRSEPGGIEDLVQKAKEVNLLDHLKLEYTAERVEVYMKVGEIEG